MWKKVKQSSAMLIMTAVVLCALAGKPALAETVTNVASAFQVVDVVLNSAAVRTSSGELWETCIVTIQGNTYPMQFGGCTELSEFLMGQLHRDYPSVIFNLIINGHNLSLM